ncbi:hypothetical protein ABEB36_013992 [Hypothenemus hampei]|uniref:Uncharacterized protein n=1 Tax=Hypothenemus hampei TaxID=57062 RepID=A0ABD1E524_HYPHA
MFPIFNQLIEEILINIVKKNPFSSAEEIEILYLETMGSTFDCASPRPINEVLNEIPGVFCLDEHVYYIPFDEELYESPYWGGQEVEEEEEEEMAMEEDGEEVMVIDNDDADDVDDGEEEIDAMDEAEGGSELFTDIDDSGWGDELTDIFDDIFGDFGWDGTPDMCPNHPGGCYCDSDCDF